MRLVTKRRVGVELQRIFGKPKWGTVILSSETMCESAKGFDQISLCQLTQNTHLTDYKTNLFECSRVRRRNGRDGRLYTLE